MPQLVLDLLQPALPTLDNFVCGQNAEALASVRAWAQNSGPQFLYLWGMPGSGRTHLLKAIAPIPDPVPAFSLHQSHYALDDVHTLDNSAQTQLFILMNEIRSTPSARLIATGNAPPNALPLREDIRTRLAWGLVYQLHPLTDHEKHAALNTQAAQRGIPMANDTINWLLAHLPRDMRTLTAALDALDAYALARKRSVTVALAREWLAQQS